VGGECGTHGRGQKVYKILYGNPEEKNPLRRPKRRRKVGIRMDLGETGLGGVDSTG
jgi:hypothetical protein